MSEVSLQRVVGRITLESGESFRYCESFHSIHLSNSKPIILLSSGKVNSFDDSSSEQKVFLFLIEQLAVRGYKVFQLQFEKRPAFREYATEEDVIKRLAVLIGFLNSDFFSTYSKGYTILGLSLGGRVLLKMLTDSAYSSLFPKVAIIVSTTVDEPCIIQAIETKIYFLYGEHDYVGYLNEDEESYTVLKPDFYSLESRKRLIIHKKQIIITEIIKNQGHLMNKGGEKSNEFIESVIKLL